MEKVHIVTAEVINFIGFTITSSGGGAGTSISNLRYVGLASE